MYPQTEEPARMHAKEPKIQNVSVNLDEEDVRIGNELISFSKPREI